MAGDVELLCRVNYKIATGKIARKEKSYKTMDSQKMRDVPFNLCLTLESAGIVFSVSYQGNKVAETIADYREDTRESSSSSIDLTLEKLELS